MWPTFLLLLAISRRASLQSPPSIYPSRSLINFASHLSQMISCFPNQLFTSPEHRAPTKRHNRSPLQHDKSYARAKLEKTPFPEISEIDRISENNVPRRFGGF
jgi:hypothetical protein